MQNEPKTTISHLEQILQGYKEQHGELLNLRDRLHEIQIKLSGPMVRAGSGESEGKPVGNDWIAQYQEQANYTGITIKDIRETIEIMERNI